MKISELRKQLDTRQIGAVELTKVCLDNIKKYNKTVNSYITVCEDEAILAAEATQTIIDDGKAGFLTGIPISVKDNICTKGIRTTCASRMLEDFIPVYDATAIEKLKKQGCIIIGKTNMDEFAFGGSSQTSYFSGVKNPYDITRVPGGSSGGAAVSVALNQCVAALGTDTGGSVRQPAAFCGVTGLKPSYGRVSRYGLIAFASSLDQIGVIADSAYDAGGVLGTICGYDKKDATSFKDEECCFTKLCGNDIKGLRIGLPKEFFEGDIDEAVKDAVLNAAETYKEMGCEIIECSFPSLRFAVSAYYIISSAEATSNMARFDGIKYGYRSDFSESYDELIKHSRREGFGTEVKRRILLGNYALSQGYYDAYYKNALKIRRKLICEYAGIFEKCDVILTPVSPTTAYKTGTIENDPVKMYLSDIFTVSQNLAGLPAISVTCGYDNDGMPIGMSITGRMYDEKTIISVADCFEKSFEKREVRL